ncbi:hypothetical protein H2201_006048 [Coniosporium apollinis]|uniref:BHLH domain-containing protein n=1 Tax=Coniosporium apollinis TaxID=61459 RepID=A0ABQ9NQE0_9PEZI|nr:hypothetical protein H2201_006048 [Coniosporium apollinis]
MTASTPPLPRLPTPIPSPSVDPCDELSDDLLFPSGLDLNDGDVDADKFSDNDGEAADPTKGSQQSAQGRRRSSWPLRGLPSLTNRTDTDDDADVESLTTSSGDDSPPPGLHRSNTDPCDDLRRGPSAGAFPPRFTWFSADKSPLNRRGPSKQLESHSNDCRVEHATASDLHAERVEGHETEVLQDTVETCTRGPLKRSHSTGHQATANKQATCPSLLAGLPRKSSVSSDTILLSAGTRRKSTAADTATTLTDVLALPSTTSSISDKSKSLSQKTSSISNSTVQIVESRNGVFEVVWDDSDPDESDEDQPEPSRSQFFQESESEYTRTDESTGPSLAGLHRVNSKLANWSWNDDSDDGRNRVGRCRFKPEVQVFTGELSPDSEVAHLDLHAPPSSKLPSEHPSREGSRLPAPRRPDLAIPAIEDETGHSEFTITSLEEIDEDHETGQTSLATVPGPYVDNKSGQVAANSRRRQLSNLVRRLSNLPEKDEHFKSHRDSLVLSRKQFYHEVSSKHLDSIAVAKERLKRKLHRAPTAPKTIRVKPTQQVRFGGLSPIMDASPPTASAAGSYERHSVTRSIDQITGSSPTQPAPRVKFNNKSPVISESNWPLPSGAQVSPSSPPRTSLRQRITASP